MTDRAKVAAGTKIYQLVEYTKSVSEYGRKEVKVDMHSVSLVFKTCSAAQKVAELAEIKSYGVFEYELDAEGFHSTSTRDASRVMVTDDVREWERQEQLQDNDKERREAGVVAQINSLPKKVTLYKDDDFLITAERPEFNKDSYRKWDLSYSLSMEFRGISLSWWEYRTGQYDWSTKKLLKKRFAQRIYELTHKAEYAKLGYTAWKDKLKSISAEYVKEYGDVLEAAYKKLDEHNAKVIIIKGGL